MCSIVLYLVSNLAELLSDANSRLLQFARSESEILHRVFERFLDADPSTNVDENILRIRQLGFYKTAGPDREQGLSVDGFPLRALKSRYCCEGLGKRGGYNIEPGLEDTCRVFEKPYFYQHLAHLVVDARCLRLSWRCELSRRGLPSGGGH